MNKLPLHDYYSEKGAEFTESNGWLLPKSFDSVKNEYDVAENGVCVFDLSARGKIRLSGKECFKFMQGMLSNDVIKLESGRGAHATLLTVKGKIIADLYIYKDGDDAFIDLEQGLNESICKLLLKYRLSYKAKIEDLTDKYIQLCFLGAKSEQYISRLLDLDLSALETPGLLNRNIDDTHISVVNVKRSSYKSFDIYVPAEAINLVTKSFFRELDGLVPKMIGLDVYETLRVEAGIPKYGVDMDENTIPIEAELWDALNFEKGCYIGQEIIARIKWRGHVNRHLVGVEIETQKPANPKDKIFVEQKEAGFVTSSVYSYKKNKAICLAYIKREFKESGTAVTVCINDEKVDGKVFNFNN
ncbi:MAG: aminomethyl transferase family protein [Candidatus Dadabacteria bacterium]|nr:aminomethyl transferase family protein [Candidatus Dadabacteria bacterium]NIS09094.1 aminomethyl transferase family protein [Candidatus Dadabacteria bacterium]NIV41530.1 hypothetical protein [Candidatus Dadabacteria bacterium]NIX15211.1 hypothetical protein [Candidatus Dadabacteria bacterium]NIY21855.1 hypothetical protein [Candidatus Dadabacteria bacterium]